MLVVAELTADHRGIVLVAGGGPDEVLRAAKVLQTLTPLFTKSDPPGALTVPATWPAVVQLSQALGSGWAPRPRLQAWIAEQVTRRTSAETLIGYAPPSRLSPYPWQVEGAAMIAATGRVLITDEPRTGKTITTILGLVERARRAAVADLPKAVLPPAEHEASGTTLLSRALARVKAQTAALPGPVLVVCPASVVDSWVEAWQVWAPHVRAVAWRGPAKKRAELPGTADVYVTSYDTARIDAPAINYKGVAPLRRVAWSSLVIDECHLIKNHQTERSQAVRRLARIATDRADGAGAVIALSGTPITHHPGDLWPTLAALEHHAWPSRDRWIKRYCTVLEGEYRDEVLGLAPRAEPEFRMTLLGQHRRVARADVMADLPAKVYSTRTVDLPASWRKAYDGMEEQMLAELPLADGSTEELPVMSTLAKLTRLSQLASAPATVQTSVAVGEDGVERPHVEVTLEAPSWKVDALLEVLAERPGEKVVVFAPSKQLIRLAGAAAAAAGHEVGWIVGGQSAAERTETIRRFQHSTGDGALNLICATTGAGGVGITLSAAGTVVFLQRPWSLVDSVQAEDRAEGPHPITGIPQRGTEVIDVVARNTVDTRVRAVLRERAGQLADLVQDPRIVAELLGGTRSTEHKKSAPDLGDSGPVSTYNEGDAA